MTLEPERMTGAGVAEGRAQVNHPIGLHARPSVKLTQLAKKYSADIRLRVADEGDWVNAKSIVRVMAMKVKVGQTLSFEAEGSDASQAVRDLISLVERNFDERGAE
ncbi:MAG: HPr family phosphocarrier protein [Alphaproteobacteria bacterium]